VREVFGIPISTGAVDKTIMRMSQPRGAGCVCTFSSWTASR